jgi:ribonuclease III
MKEKDFSDKSGSKNIIDFSDFEKKIEIFFKDKDFLIQAFCHRSYLNENPEFRLNHNERLEFLGDAVLELIVTEYLFRKYPEKPEGELTSWRASLVNTKRLSEVAKEIGLNDYILLSKGEIKENGQLRQSTLANTFESLVGAMYLDFGYDKCYKFVNKNLIKKLDKIIELGLNKDSKSCFQEKAQAEKSVTPIYKVLKEWGPDHKKTFRIGVFLNEELVAEGEGFSKQQGEEDAAKKALKIKGW